MGLNNSTAAADALQALGQPVVFEFHQLEGIDHLAVRRLRARLFGGCVLLCMTRVAILLRLEGTALGRFGEKGTGGEGGGQQNESGFGEGTQNRVSMDLLSRASVPLRRSRWPMSSPDSL